MLAPTKAPLQPSRSPTSFITYRFPGAGDPANLLSTTDRSPERYLTLDGRDFVAVYLR